MLNTPRKSPCGKARTGLAAACFPVSLLSVPLFAAPVLVFALAGCGAEHAPEPASRELRAAMLNAEDARGLGLEGIQPLLEGLAAVDPETRMLAVRGIGRLEDSGHVGTIAPLLAEPNPQVRAEAANALGQAVFSSEGDTVAALILSRLPHEGVSTVLGAMGRTLGRVRYADCSNAIRAENALVALTMDGEADPRVPALTGAVMGLEWMARRNRAVGLAVGTVERLRALVSSGAPERVRRVSMMALLAARGVDPGSIEVALADPDPDLRRLGLAAVGELVASDVSARRGQADESTAEPAGEEMVPAGGPAQTFFQQVVRALGDPVARVRVQALQTYADLPPTGETCTRLLRATDDPVVQVALTALNLVSAHCPPTPELLDALTALARDPGGASASRWHRGAHALRALAGVAPEALLSASAASDDGSLLARYIQHSSPFARAHAAWAAAALGDVAALEALASDSVDNVRTAAVRGLFRLQGHGADGVLRNQLTRDDPELLLTVANLLEGTPDPAAALGSLVEALGRMSAGRRQTARDPRMAMVDRIAEVGGPEQAAGLRPYLTDYDPVVAERVAEVLREWTGEPHEAQPQPLSRVPVPSPEEVDRLDRAGVILEMEGGGEIEIALFGTLAPTNAARFERLAQTGYFDGLTFHRVEPNFVIQGGSPGANEMAGDGPYTRDELGLQSNWRGTVGLSTRGRDTGDGQIFINLVDNLRLDHNYTIFGEVVAGMDVVDRVVEGQVIVRARVEAPG